MTKTLGLNVDEVIYKSKALVVFYRWTHNMIHQVVKLKNIQDE